MHKMAHVQLTSKNDLPNRENPISVLSFFYFHPPKVHLTLTIFRSIFISRYLGLSQRSLPRNTLEQLLF